MHRNRVCVAISTFWKQEGVLKRVYGGAVSVQAPPNRAFDYAVESVRLSDEKSRIARLTAGLIENGQTVILDGGSTVAAVARELAAKSLHIVTNSLPIAESLEIAAQYRADADGRVSGPAAARDAGAFLRTDAGAIRADAVIMGVGGITEAGLSNNNTLVVGSEQKMIEVASRVIIVADHTKFGRGGMIPVAPLDGRAHRRLRFGA